MARVENQSIPSNLLDDYSNVLAPTRFMNTNYGRDTVHRDSCERKYPDHPEQADDPSEEQEHERWTFAEACEAWQNTTPQEQSAYYQLSLVSGWFHFNFFMSRFILAILKDHHWEELLRPHALRYDMGSGNGKGYALWTLANAEQATATWDIELDPATWKDHGYTGPHVPHYIRFTSAPVYPEWYPPLQEGFIELNCTERTRFTGTFEDASELPRDITLEFYVSSTEAHPVILWEMRLDENASPDERLYFLP